MRAAAKHGRTGENYLLPGHRLAMSDLAGLAQTCSTVAVTGRTAPDWAVSLCAPLATVIAARTQNPLLPTYESLRALRRFPTVDGTKAARDLGHQPRLLEETLADLHAFFTEKDRRVRQA
jgi:dihydroflavonol-4-reductase